MAVVMVTIARLGRRRLRLGGRMVVMMDARLGRAPRKGDRRGDQRGGQGANRTDHAVS
jgi:hypothetical protein